MIRPVSVLLVALVVACLLAAAPRRSAGVHADTTDVVVIGCEFIAGAVDGDVTNPISDADVQAACGGRPSASAAPAALPPTAAFGLPSVQHLAQAIGDQDGNLEASDFRGAFDEGWDDNQINTDCSTQVLFTAAALQDVGGNSVSDLLSGLGCSLTVFVFVNGEAPVSLDVPAGISSVEGYASNPSGSGDYLCMSDVGIDPDGAGPLPVPPPILQDNDCAARSR